ncbi:MAG: glycosyltransferase [Bacteroidales bacterium]|nr:glycosyltransferase [Bacteroidales bacterium]
MRILAIIVSYNFEPWLERNLNSLINSEHPVSILVIDNLSSDQTVQHIQKEYPEVQLITNTKNLGFGAANNIGFRMAVDKGFDAVFLLNQDAWIDRKTIGTLVSLSLKNSSVGILSPVHLNGAGNYYDKGFADYTGLDSLDELSQQNVFINVPFINAAFWFIPVRVLKTVGSFCPLFHHYGEDKDYINRLIYHGFTVGYSPLVFGYHDREQREVNEEALFISDKVYFLTEYVNIRYSFLKAFILSIIAPFKKVLFHLKKRNLKKAWKYFTLSLSCFAKTPAVIRYRRINKKGGSNDW